MQQIKGFKDRCTQNNTNKNSNQLLTPEKLKFYKKQKMTRVYNLALWWTVCSQDNIKQLALDFIIGKLAKWEIHMYAVLFTICKPGKLRNKHIT